MVLLSFTLSMDVLSIHYIITLTLLVDSVLKSGPRTGKKLATKLDCNQFGPAYHGCRTRVGDKL